MIPGKPQSVPGPFASNHSASNRRVSISLSPEVPARDMPPYSSSFPHVLFGRLLIILAVAGWLISLAADLQELPAGLQRFVRTNAAMWWVGCGLLFVIGVRLLWLVGHRRTQWQPATPGVRFRTIIVYSRKDCMLCEEAMELLLQYRRWLPIPSEVDIDTDTELQTRFNESIPVVEIDGRIRFQGTVNEILLRRLIEGSPPLPSLLLR